MQGCSRWWEVERLVGGGRMIERNRGRAKTGKGDIGNDKNKYILAW